MKPLVRPKDRLLFLSLLSLILVTSSSLVINSSSTPRRMTIEEHKADLPPTPSLSENARFPFFSAEAVMAIDLDSGTSLYEKNPNSRLLPASTTKIMTALVSLETYPLDSVLTVGDIKIDGQKMGLVKGEKIRVEDLLYGLLVYSANDAAEALAQNYEGGEEAFVVAMNQKAREFQLENTNFKNPSGLDGDSQVTTARDLVRVAQIAMKYPEFAKIVGTRQRTVASIDGKISHRLVNINELLGKVPGVLGVKTGWTENARENLVTYVERDGHKVMIAILGSEDRFGETKELIDWVFANYTWQKPSYSP